MFLGTENCFWKWRTKRKKNNNNNNLITPFQLIKKVMAPLSANQKIHDPPPKFYIPAPLR